MKSFLRYTKAVRKAILTGALFLAIPVAPAQAVDEEAAENLAKANRCFKCHAIDKAKKAPPYKRIAQKYKGRADAEAALIKHLSGSQSVKVEDGGDEQHEPPPVKDAELRNLVQWILTR